MRRVRRYGSSSETSCKVEAMGATPLDGDDFSGEASQILPGEESTYLDGVLGSEYSEQDFSA